MKVYVGEITIKIPFASVAKSAPSELHRHYIDLISRDETTQVIAGSTARTAMEITINSKEFDL